MLHNIKQKNSSVRPEFKIHCRWCCCQASVPGAAAGVAGRAPSATAAAAALGADGPSSLAAARHAEHQQLHRLGAARVGRTAGED